MMLTQQISDSPLINNAFPIWITKKSLALKLGISTGLITRLVYADGLPHLKAGRSIRFNYDAVLNWFEKRGDLIKH